MAKRVTRCGQEIIRDARPTGAVAVGNLFAGVGRNEWTDYHDDYGRIFEEIMTDKNSAAKMAEFWRELDEHFSELRDGFYWYPVEAGQFSARFFYMPNAVRGRIPDETDWSRFGELAELSGLYWHRRAFGLVSDVEVIRRPNSRRFKRREVNVEPEEVEGGI